MQHDTRLILTNAAKDCFIKDYMRLLYDKGYSANLTW